MVSIYSRGKQPHHHVTEFSVTQYDSYSLTLLITQATMVTHKLQESISIFAVIRKNKFHLLAALVLTYLSLFVLNLVKQHHLDPDHLANASAMVHLDQVDPHPIQNDDDISTIYTAAATPPETVISDLLDDGTEPGKHLVPWPNSTFIIRSVTSGHLLTLLDGQIVLAPPGRSSGSIHWACVETKGWLGFQNVVSGKFLGHDAKGRLNCSAERHREWEWFDVRTKPDGGSVLLMKHWERLWHVGIKVEEGVERLAKIGDGASGGEVWEFAPI